MEMLSPKLSHLVTSSVQMLALFSKAEISSHLHTCAVCTSWAYAGNIMQCLSGKAASSSLLRRTLSPVSAPCPVLGNQKKPKQTIFLSVHLVCLSVSLSAWPVACLSSFLHSLNSLLTLWLLPVPAIPGSQPPYQTTLLSSHNLGGSEGLLKENVFNHSITPNKMGLAGTAIWENA